MPQKIRFHLDENVKIAVAFALRREGIDVTYPRETGLAGKTDETQLEFAHNHKRVLITHDDDFLRLHNMGITHSGIVYCHQQKRTIGEMAQSLMLIAETMSAEEIEQHVEFI